MEYNSSYTIVEAAKEDFINYPKRIEILPKRWQRKKKEQYREKNLPVLRETEDYLGMPGERLVLPYTVGELAGMEQEEACLRTETILQREAVGNLIISERLHSYLEVQRREVCIDGGMMPLFFLAEAVKWVRRTHEIERRQMHIILMDEEDGRAGFVLKQLGDHLNHLTIVTGREHYFQDYAAHMFETSGLVVSIVPRPVWQQLDGNIVIDLNARSGNDFKFYPRNCALIQCYPDRKKTRAILAKRKDIHLYNRVVLKKNGQIVDNRILQAHLCGQKDTFSFSAFEQMEKQIQNAGIIMEQLGIKI